MSTRTCAKAADSVLASPQARTCTVDFEVTTVQKRGPRDLSSLCASAHQSRYDHVTLLGDGKGHFLDGSKTRSDPQSVWRSHHDKAISAAESSWVEYNKWKECNVDICLISGAILSISWDREDEATSSSLTPGMSKARKFAMQYFLIEKFGAPDEEDWDAPNFHRSLSLPAVMASLLDIPSGSSAEVSTAMRAIIAAHKAGEIYDPSAAIKEGRGAKPKIVDLTPQAEVVYNAMESGFSLGNTVVLVNQWRRVRHQEPLSYGALQRFVAKSAVMQLTKRETIKSGSSDVDTAWSVARFAFAQQLKRQFRKGHRIQAGGAHFVAEEDGDEVQSVLERPIFSGAVAFGDEVCFSLFTSPSIPPEPDPSQPTTNSTTATAG